jgi:small multidrug resistance pump
LNGYVMLGIAIACEVVATSSLKATEGFSRPLPTLLTLAGYGIAFWALSVAIRTIPVGIAYAIWCGVGIIAITAIAWIFLKQRLDLPALIGMALILAGVLVINLFSKAG